MKRLWIAAVAAGWAWAAQAGMGIVWSTCGWIVEAGGNGAPPDLFYFPADGYGLVLDRTVPPAVPPVPYLDPTTHTTNTCTTYTLYDGRTELTNGWWVIADNTTNEVRIAVSGNVNLILCDGASLTAPKGVDVGVDGATASSLTIWAQSDGDGMGALTAVGTGNTAGIGGGAEGAGGRVTVNGGMVTAFGGTISVNGTPLGGAGIGGGRGGAGGTVTVNGGKVKAKGNGGGAGIGGGHGGAGGSVTVNGGEVIARCGGAGTDPFDNVPPTVDCGQFENATVLVNYHPDKGENDSGKYMDYASARKAAGEAAGYVYTLENKADNGQKQPPVAFRADGKVWKV